MHATSPSQQLSTDAATTVSATVHKRLQEPSLTHLFVSQQRRRQQRGAGRGGPQHARRGSWKRRRRRQQPFPAGRRRLAGQPAAERRRAGAVDVGGAPQRPKVRPLPTCTLCCLEVHEMRCRPPRSWACRWQRSAPTPASEPPGIIPEPLKFRGLHTLHRGCFAPMHCCNAADRGLVGLHMANSSECKRAILLPSSQVC